DLHMVVTARPNGGTARRPTTTVVERGRPETGRQSPGGGDVPAIEVWGGHGCETVTLSAAEYTLGSDAEHATLAIDDSTVSGVHAILERVGGVWQIRDFGSLNGTRIDNERLVQPRRLRHRDEILVGRTRLVFLDAASARRPRTDALAPPPANITPKEK